MIFLELTKSTNIIFISAIPLSQLLVPISYYCNISKVLFSISIYMSSTTTYLDLFTGEQVELLLIDTSIDISIITSKPVPQSSTHNRGH